MPAHIPFVLIPCDHRLLGKQHYHVLGRKYADAVHDTAGCLPLLVPTGNRADIDAYLDLASGVLLTGSPANVHPSHFGEAVRDPALPLDLERDAVTLPLVHRAIARGLPLLAVCRGLQEINVALGGSLHQALHEVAGFADHREHDVVSLDEQYGPVHEIELTTGGMLVQIAGTDRLTVNSLHGQGIARLAAGLAVEARAPDGVIEAVRLTAHPGFALALQWHPEWKATENPLSMKIFTAFGAACRAYAQRPWERAA